MENFQHGVFEPESQNANYDFNLSPFPGSNDFQNAASGDIYGTADFSDVDLDRMTEREYFNYLRSQDDMI
jgi:hypothetical protein